MTTNDKKPGKPRKTPTTKASDQLSGAEIRELRAGCNRSVWGHGLLKPADSLAEIAAIPPKELTGDRYGDGGTVAVLENEIAELLGKPAVLMPSGTMIQQIALRIHADSRASKVVAFHPTCHLELHEDKAYQRLHDLVGLTVGSRNGLITLNDLESIHEPLAALLIELPQREIGGPLPAWSDLTVQLKWATAHGAATHLDGARLWACGPFYGRPLADVIALFDSAYVSLYKDLGGLAGGLLLGDEVLIAEAREWRHRHGGTLPSLWPIAAAGLAGLRRRLPRIPLYVDHARAIAAALAKMDGISVVPDPPPTNMFHIYLRTTPAAVTAAIRRLAKQQKLWAFSGTAPAEVPGYQALELTVGDATLDFSADEVAEIVQSFLSA